MNFISRRVLSTVIIGSLFISQSYAQSQSSGEIDNNALTGKLKSTSKVMPNPAPTTPAQPTPSAPSGPIAGVPVNLESCFSPNGGCDQKLISLISSSRSSLDVAIYSITHAGIADAIKAAKARGVRVRMVVDRSQSKGRSSLVDALVSDGIDLKIGNFSGIMHDKFTIVDNQELETGSFNYSDNATANNAENQLYLDDQNVIKNYQTNFDSMFANALAN